MKKIFLATLAAFCALTASAKPKDVVNPLDFGFRRAVTGLDRYYCLLDAHKAAVKRGARISYKGISVVNLDFPKGGEPIPLVADTDFAGAEFYVKNLGGHGYLFSLHGKNKKIKIDKKIIDSGDFSGIPELASGEYILHIHDKTPWTERRGYGYYHWRNDILLIRDGKAVNKTIMPYNTPASDPECEYAPTFGKEIHIRNISFTRDEESTAKTFLFDLQYLDNLHLSNIAVYTPAPNGWGYDQAIDVANVTRMVMDSIIVDGTYSHKGHSGYGVHLDNIWDLEVNNMYGNAAWGVFGTNDMNRVHITNSKINRFDIHNYGKDVFLENTTFITGVYNQYSCVYGYYRFDNCIFERDYVPALMTEVYNCFTPYELSFNNCQWTVTKTKNILFRNGYHENVVNPRDELSERCWPNVSINNLTLIIEPDVEIVNLIGLRGRPSTDIPVEYLSKFTINGLKCVVQEGAKAPTIKLCSHPITTSQPLTITLDNVDTAGGKIVPNLKQAE